MAFEQRDMSGALFKNDKKGNEKRPDYTGKAMVDGEEYRLAAWIKESRGGQKFLSLSFTDPDESRESDARDDDDIPF